MFSSEGFKSSHWNPSPESSKISHILFVVELQWMESQRKLLQFSMQYWKNRPPEDFLKVQQEFANLKTEEIMQKVLENAKSVLNDEKFNFPSVKDLPRPSRDDIIRFQEVSKLLVPAHCNSVVAVDVGPQDAGNHK